MKVRTNFRNFSPRFPMRPWQKIPPGRVPMNPWIAMKKPVLAARVSPHRIARAACAFPDLMAMCVPSDAWMNVRETGIAFCCPGMEEEYFACAPGHLNLCRPCTESGQCETVYSKGKCINRGVRKLCGSNCDPADAEGCPSDYSCAEVESVEGVLSFQCVLGSEEESLRNALAIAEQAVTTCSVENEFGTCEGTRVCGAEGLSACSATEAVAEQCNGVDDNCDGSLDDGACAGGLACVCEGVS